MFSFSNSKTKIMGSLRSNILTGILVLTPIGAVFWIMVWLWNFLFVLSDLLPSSYRPTELLGLQSSFSIWLMEFLLTVIILILVLLFIWAVGFLSRYYIGKKLFEAIAHFMEHVPVLRSVYSTLRQLLGTFASDQGKKFRRVVLVEYPRAGMYSLAFVTGERLGEGKFLNIFIPTTPNPTSGFYLSVAENDVQNLDISVEDALKEIISLGLVQKDHRTTTYRPS